MIWWTWGLIGWSLLASAGVLWLAVMCRIRRRRTGLGRPAVPRGARPASPALSAAEPEEPPSTGSSTQPLEYLRPLVDGGRAGGEVRSKALERLLAGARAGDYTLPEAVAGASAGSHRLRGLELRAPRRFGRADAAAHLLSEAAAGRPLDPMALAARIDRSRSQMQLFVEAQEVVAMAAEQGRDAAAAVAGDMSERIVGEHLRPAHREVLRGAKRVAARLARYTDDRFELDTRGIVAASGRVRRAYAALPDLVRRHRAIRDALEAVNVLAGHPPRHDSRDLFAFFQDPLVFSAPGLPYDRAPEAPVPGDDTARLLWLVSDQAAIGRPWLPTAREQDMAWLSAFEAPGGIRRTSRIEPGGDRAAARPARPPRPRPLSAGQRADAEDLSRVGRLR